jgi:hypothetical protein
VLQVWVGTAWLCQLAQILQVVDVKYDSKKGSGQSWATEAMKRCDEALNASSLQYLCLH